jgi:hypothetical protein
LAQIKNYYYDHHKKNRNNGGEDSMRTSAPESTDGDSDAVERSEMYFAATGGAAQFRSGGMMTAVEARVTEQQRAALHSQSLQSAADIWARAQIQHQQEQHLQQHEQQLQQQLSSQEAHRLLHSHQHQQVISNISSMFPWVTAAQVAQAQVQVQAAAIQQQQSQQQQQQESNELDWQNRKYARRSGYVLLIGTLTSCIYSLFIESDSNAKFVGHEASRAPWVLYGPVVANALDCSCWTCSHEPTVACCEWSEYANGQ